MFESFLNVREKRRFTVGIKCLKVINGAYAPQRCEKSSKLWLLHFTALYFVLMVNLWSNGFLSFFYTETLWGGKRFLRAADQKNVRAESDFLGRSKKNL